MDELVYAHSDRGFALLSLRSPRALALLRPGRARRGRRRVAGRPDLGGARPADGARRLDAARGADPREGRDRDAQVRRASRCSTGGCSSPATRRTSSRRRREGAEPRDQRRAGARRGARRGGTATGRPVLARRLLRRVPAARLALRALLLVDDEHAAPAAGGDGFDVQLQLAQLRHVTTSEAAATGARRELHGGRRCLSSCRWRRRSAATFGTATSVALEGFTHLIPHAAGHEVIRQGRRDLTLVRMTPDVIYDQLIGMGCARRLVFSWGGNPGVGSLHRLRDAVENGWPAPLELEEHSHAGMAAAYAAGAANLPFGVLRGYRGTDSPRARAWRRSTCPFTGEELAAVPAHRPGRRRSSTRSAPTGAATSSSGGSSASRRRSCSRRRARSSPWRRSWTSSSRGPERVVLPSWAIDAVCVRPGGAHPSYAHGYYDRDNDFYVRWDAISRDRDTFREWMERHVARREAGMTEVHGGRDDGRRGGAAAAGRQRLLRRHRPAQPRLQPRARDARAAARARLRVRHDRREADGAAALDRRRRARGDGRRRWCPCRRCSRTGSRAAASTSASSAPLRSTGTAT